MCSHVGATSPQNHSSHQAWTILHAWVGTSRAPALRNSCEACKAIVIKPDRFPWFYLLLYIEKTKCFSSIVAVTGQIYRVKYIDWPAQNLGNKFPSHEWWRLAASTGASFAGGQLELFPAVQLERNLSVLKMLNVF